MRLEDVIQRILSFRPDLTRDELLVMIREKEKMAKGFLTTESAALALAAELGVETPDVPLKHVISIGDLILGLSDVTVIGRVIFLHPPQKFIRPDGTEGTARRIIIADKTGQLKVTLWDDKAGFPDIEESLGKVVKFTHGYVRQGFDGKLELNIGLRGILEAQPPNIPEIEYPPLNRFIKRINEITEEEKTVNVLGMVKRVHTATTFKKPDGTEGKVRRLEVEDNSGKITVVLWNNKAEEITEAEQGKYVEIFKAKVKKRLDGSLELHAVNSTSILILTKKPSVLEDL